MFGRYGIIYRLYGILYGCIYIIGDVLQLFIWMGLAGDIAQYMKSNYDHITIYWGYVG